MFASYRTTALAALPYFIMGWRSQAALVGTLPPLPCLLPRLTWTQQAGGAAATLHTPY